MKNRFFNETRAFTLLCAQAGLGPRYPGVKGHEQVIELITNELGSYCPDVTPDPFTITLKGSRTQCRNILGRVKGDRGGKRILIGTHFDTRPIADRETDPILAKMPIPGANDGGSGTAVMIEIARVLSLASPPGDVIFAFFDAEDVGHLDKNNFYRGSAHFVRNMGDFKPDEVLILDMVGGKGMCLDVELNCFAFDSLYRLGVKDMFLKLIRIARRYDYSQIYGMKREKLKYIECDHIPFLQAKIPSYILIDIDYPQWHTHQDIPAHCSPASLRAVGDVVLEYIYDSDAP